MKKTALTLMMLTLATFVQAQTIEHVYHFQNPVVIEHDGYQQIGFDGCMPTGQVGEPSLPWQSISLMLPQGTEATEVHVEFLDYTELDGELRLYPYQKPRPYSHDGEIPFAKDERLYRSSDPYPARQYSTVSTQYLNGVGMAFSGFTPVEYIPATGKVRYAQTVIVRVETTNSRSDHSRKVWLTPDNEASLRRLAQNAEQIESYRSRSREISGYDMLVITSEEWIPSFDEYLNLYNGKGVRTQIVSLEQIYATMSGRDVQEQIRNYIIQEYENNGIQTVILGGDVNIVPFRPLWCWAQEDTQDQLPADMYYACLDGTLNDDDDDRWGEVGEDDLLPELSIGRLPFINMTQFNRIMNKTFNYLLNPVLGEFTSPILGAEHLGDGYYGSDDMERLIGISSDFGYTTQGYPSDYNFKRHYASPEKAFNGGIFQNVIGTGGQYVHHVGHANTDYVAEWDLNSIDNASFANNNGTEHNYMLFHSHGCVCGDFSHNCILERLVTIPNGFALTTGNSRYGWYVPWGDGMAAHIHREFMNAYCHDRIPSVGMALREAKIATAPWVTAEGENGCFRWNIYCLNVLGDAALCPWFEEPFTPNVRFDDGLAAGTTSSTVHVSYFDQPLSNFQVSLFDGTTLLGRATTDENGDAVMQFSPALSVIGPMQLIVTGQSAWPQTFEVTGIENGEAYVYGDILGFNAPTENGSTLQVAAHLYNKGNVAAQNIHTAITSDCEYVTTQPSDITIDVFDANSTLYYDNIGVIGIADNIPDQTIFTLNLATSLGEVTHTTGRTFLAMAPNMCYDSFVIDDSDGNGYADPGESASLHIFGRNAGHAMASDASMTVTCDDNRIHFSQSTFPLGNIGAGESFSVDLGFTSDSDIHAGTLFHFNMTLHTGSYTTEYDYVMPIGMVAEDFESGGFDFMEWFHSGALPWAIDNEEAHTGDFCARSGAIDNGQITRLVVYANVPVDGEISFWHKTSTEQNRDYFVFKIDDKNKGFWSGENEWSQTSYSIDAGNHKFEWYYKKDGRNAVGADCAWIDDIIFPRATIISDVEETHGAPSTKIYPNPNKGFFTIELVEESTVTINNMMGHTVTTLDNALGMQKIQLEGSGLYLVQIRNASGVENLKVIVE